MKKTSNSSSYRKTIYIKDKAALDHLEKQPNQSAYITELILKDLDACKSVTKEEVIELIKEYAKAKPEIETISQEVEETLDLETPIKNTIESLAQ